MERGKGRTTTHSTPRPYPSDHQSAAKTKVKDLHDGSEAPAEENTQHAVDKTQLLDLENTYAQTSGAYDSHGASTNLMYNPQATGKFDDVVSRNSDPSSFLPKDQNTYFRDLGVDFNSSQNASVTYNHVNNTHDPTNLTVKSRLESNPKHPIFNSTPTLPLQFNVSSDSYIQSDGTEKAKDISGINTIYQQNQLQSFKKSIKKSIT